jgi:hypothetical protein
MYWKRIVHSIITILFIYFVVWYFLPDNRIIRNNDVCSIYANQINKVCVCSTTIFYPNLSVSKPFNYYYPNIKSNVSK